MDIKDCIGDLIGRGNYRYIYKHKYDSNLVIKKTMNGKPNQNIVEWKLWNKIKNTQYKDIFCPCIEISNDQIYLIMIKTINSKPVVVDYGNPKNLKILDKL